MVHWLYADINKNMLNHLLLIDASIYVYLFFYLFYLYIYIYIY